jgi:hypothetical protein
VNSHLCSAYPPAKSGDALFVAGAQVAKAMQAALRGEE